MDIAKLLAFSQMMGGDNPGGGSSGGSNAKITEYIFTENADRSLWFNEQKIKLVKGVNVFITDKFKFLPSGSAEPAHNQGAIVIMWLLWDGVADKSTTANGATFSPKRHLMTRQIVESTYSWSGGGNELVSGNTSAIEVLEDGTLICTTSATGVITGNFNNSFFEAGYTYKFIQAPVEGEFR